MLGDARRHGRARDQDRTARQRRPRPLPGRCRWRGHEREAQLVLRGEQSQQGIDHRRSQESRRGAKSSTRWPRRPMSSCRTSARAWLRGLASDYASLKECNDKHHLCGGDRIRTSTARRARSPPSITSGLARSGIMNAAGEPGMPPLGVAGGIADQMGAVMMAYGVMTALLARERHGMGQEVSASHLGSMTFLQGLSVSMKLMAGFAMPQQLPREGRQPPLEPLPLRRRPMDRARDVATRSLLGGFRAGHRAQGSRSTDERFCHHGAARGGNAEECVAVDRRGLRQQTPRRVGASILNEDPGDYIFTIVNSRRRPSDGSPGPGQRLHRRQWNTRNTAPRRWSESPSACQRNPRLRAQGRAGTWPGYRGRVLMDVLGWDWERGAGAPREGSHLEAGVDAHGSRKTRRPMKRATARICGRRPDASPRISRGRACCCIQPGACSTIRQRRPTQAPRYCAPSAEWDTCRSTRSTSWPARTIMITARALRRATSPEHLAQAHRTRQGALRELGP